MAIQQHRSKRPFVHLPIDLLRSKEFCQLSNAAKMLWIYLRADFNPNKNQTNSSGEIEVKVAYSTLKKIAGFKNDKTIENAFLQLREANFIKRTTFDGKGIEAHYTFIGKYKDFPNQIKKNRRWKK